MLRKQSLHIIKMMEIMIQIKIQIQEVSMVLMDKVQILVQLIPKDQIQVQLLLVITVMDQIKVLIKMLVMKVLNKLNII